MLRGAEPASAAETHTTAPAQAVWSLWSDAARWHEWNDQIAEASLLGPFELVFPRFRGHLT